MIWITVSLLLLLLMSFLMFLMEENVNYKDNFLMNIECGFNSFNLHKKFFNQFFMISAIFVIFDMELVIILPIPVIDYTQTFILISSILILLVLSLLVEVLNGLIYWSK